MAQNFQEENAKTFLKFENSCYAEGLGKERIRKYEYFMRYISNFLGKSYETATREDIENVARRLEESDYSEWTKYDFRVALKKFWKWLRKTEDSYPPEVRWIKNRIKNSDVRLPEEILTEEEIKRLIDSCTNLRDRVFISFLYESGCRIGEMLSIKMKNIEFDEYGAVARVHGKTGSRRIRLINSVPYLTKWMIDHPRKDDPEAAFFTRLVLRTEKVGALHHASALKLLTTVARRAGIKKRVNPHSFRHARATHLANWMTDVQMCLYFGWEIGSDMPRTYCHLSGKDLDDTILRIHGKAKNEERKDPLEPKVCGRCQMQNPADAPICGRCGLPFNEKMAMEVEKKREEFMNLVNNPSVIEKLIDQRVKEILRDKGITV
jgi:site-specific recombinase XerD/ribosomal protein L40E